MLSGLQAQPKHLTHTAGNDASSKWLLAAPHQRYSSPDFDADGSINDGGNPSLRGWNDKSENAIPRCGKTPPYVDNKVMLRNTASFASVLYKNTAEYRITDGRGSVSPPTIMVDRGLTR